MAFQLFPSIGFNESNVGPRPLRSVTIDRVGMVGQFSRGPAAPAIADANDAVQLFGADATVGSVQLQAILDQGVSDLLIQRVLPRARSASLSVTLSGTVAGTGSFSVSYKVGAAVQVDIPVTIVAGDTASVVVTKIVAAVQAASPASPALFAVDTGNTGTTGKLKVTAVTPGAAGSTIQVRGLLTTFTGLTATTPATFLTALQSLVGGADAPVAPTVTLVNGATQLLKLTMIHPGTSGNTNTKAVVSAAIDAGKFDLVLTNAVWGITETYMDLDLTDIYDVDKLARLRNSRLATGVVLSSAAVPSPGTFDLIGGADGDSANVSTEDFIAAIDALETLNCTIICAPGIKPVGVDQWSLNAVLLAQAEAGEVEMGELIGLRIAILAAPRGMVAEDLPALKTASRIPNSKRAVMVAGWGTSARQPRYNRFGVDPSAVYAGHLLVTPPQVSPAARTSSPTIKGITEVDTPVRIPQLNEITRYRMDAIINDPAIGALHMLNGRSTSADPAWYWIMYRRVYDKIRTDVFVQSQFTKSEPSNPALDRVFQQLIDGYLENQLASGLIAGYNPTVSNDSNNPPAVRALGQRYVDVFFELTPANDQTQFNLNRVTQASIRVA